MAMERQITQIDIEDLMPLNDYLNIIQMHFENDADFKICATEGTIPKAIRIAEVSQERGLATKRRVLTSNDSSPDNFHWAKIKILMRKTNGGNRMNVPVPVPASVPGHNFYPPPVPGHNFYPPPVPGHNFYAPPVPGHNFYPPPVPGQNFYAPPVPGHNFYAPPVPGHNFYPPPVPGHNFYPPPIPGHNFYAPTVPGYNFYAPPVPGYNFYAPPVHDPVHRPMDVPIPAPVYKVSKNKYFMHGLNGAKTYLNSHMEIQLCALEGAIPKAIKIAETLVRTRFAAKTEVLTYNAPATDNPADRSLDRAKIKIRLRRIAH